MTEEPITEEELIGTHQDLILDRFGKPIKIEVKGKNSLGLVADWYYDKFKLTFSRLEDEEPVNHTQVSAYFVTKVEIKGEKHARK